MAQCGLLAVQVSPALLELPESLGPLGALARPASLEAQASLAQVVPLATRGPQASLEPQV